jgi:hypothetical protein
MSIQHISKSSDLEDDEILIREFSGEVYLSDILDSWKNILDNNLINENTQGILNNLLDCSLCMNKDDFQHLN